MKITLKDLRIRSDLSQQSVAETIGLTQPRIAKIESGINIGIDTLESYLIGCGYKLEIAAIEPDGTRHVVNHEHMSYRVRATDHGTLLFTPAEGRRRSPLEIVISIADDNSVNAARIGEDWKNYRDLDHFYNQNNIELDSRSASVVRMYLTSCKSTTVTRQEAVKTSSAGRNFPHVVMADDVQISTSAKIGNNVMLGSMVKIERDVKIGNNVTILDNVLIESGSIIEDNVLIESRNIIESNAHIKSGTHIKTWSGLIS